MSLYFPLSSFIHERSNVFKCFFLFITNPFSCLFQILFYKYPRICNFSDKYKHYIDICGPDFIHIMQLRELTSIFPSSPCFPFLDGDRPHVRRCSALRQRAQRPRQVPGRLKRFRKLFLFELLTHLCVTYSCTSYF